MTNEEIDDVSMSIVELLQECDTTGDADAVIDMALSKFIIITSPSVPTAVYRRDAFIDGLIDLRKAFEKFAKSVMVPGNEVAE